MAKNCDLKIVKLRPGSCRYCVKISARSVKKQRRYDLIFQLCKKNRILLPPFDLKSGDLWYIFVEKK